MTNKKQKLQVSSYNANSQLAKFDKILVQILFYWYDLKQEVYYKMNNNNNNNDNDNDNNNSNKSLYRAYTNCPKRPTIDTFDNIR